MSKVSVVVNNNVVKREIGIGTFKIFMIWYNIDIPLMIFLTILPVFQGPNFVEFSTVILKDVQTFHTFENNFVINHQFANYLHESLTSDQIPRFRHLLVNIIVNNFH